jgi:hypothetical protein
MVARAALWQVFSEYSRFPCHSFHRLLLTHHHPSQETETSHYLADYDIAKYFNFGNPAVILVTSFSGFSQALQANSNSSKS